MNELKTQKESSKGVENFIPFSVYWHNVLISNLSTGNEIIKDMKIQYSWIILTLLMKKLRVGVGWVPIP